MIINVHIHVDCPLCVSDFKETLIFSTDFRKILKYQISWKKSNESRIGPSGQTDRRTDGLRQTDTDMMKLIVVFRNFANAPKN